MVILLLLLGSLTLPGCIDSSIDEVQAIRATRPSHQDKDASLYEFFDESKIVQEPSLRLIFSSYPSKLEAFQKFSLTISVLDKTNKLSRDHKKPIYISLINIQKNTKAFNLSKKDYKRRFHRFFKSGHVPPELVEFLTKNVKMDSTVRSLFEQRPFPKNFLPIVEMISIPDRLIPDLKKLILTLEEKQMLQGEMPSTIPTSGFVEYSNLLALPSFDGYLTITAKSEGLKTATLRIPFINTKTRLITLDFNQNVFPALYFYPNTIVFNSQRMVLSFQDRNIVRTPDKSFYYEWTDSNYLKVRSISEQEADTGEVDLKSVLP